MTITNGFKIFWALVNQEVTFAHLDDL